MGILSRDSRAPVVATILLLLMTTRCSGLDCPEAYETYTGGDTRDDVDLAVESSGYTVDSWYLLVDVRFREGESDLIEVGISGPFCREPHLAVFMTLESGGAISAFDHHYYASEDCPDEVVDERLEFQELTVEGTITYEHDGRDVTIQFDDVRFRDTRPPTVAHPQITGIALDGEFTAALRRVACL